MNLPAAMWNQRVSLFRHSIPGLIVLFLYATEAEIFICRIKKRVKKRSYSWSLKAEKQT